MPSSSTTTTDFSKPPDADTLRVLIATDTHLGAHESNAIRKDDAFLAFEEIFETAVAARVDCVFLAGDVFDINKPSRETLVRTMEILRKHAFGDKPVAVEVVSDTKENFPSRGIVNYEDPNANVALPIFSIHGNHDDPAGEANLSAMDILAQAGLVNYFGKHGLGGGGAGRVDLKPVLMRKGLTKLALYGLGYIRDNRLHQMFSVKGCVRWHRPAETSDCSSSSWFNVMLIHQNRAAHSKNAISDRYLPEWLDYVVWGHEHECLIEPTEVPGGFHISQPGSSVVTSLIEGEAKEKKICVLEVKADPENANGAPYWRTTSIPLKSTRPFEFEQIALASIGELETTDQKGLSAYLEARVNAMISRAHKKARERHAPKAFDISDRLNLPLIRLRVDYSGGFSTINPQRFGQKFVGKVANPNDILLFHKSAKKRAGNGMDIDEDMSQEDELAMEEEAHAEGLLEDQRRIDRLVREHLSASEGLQLLTSNDLSAALDDFVNRDEKTAIAKLCSTRLKDVQSSVNAEARNADDPTQLMTKIQEAVQMQMKKPTKHKPVLEENAADGADVAVPKRLGRASIAAAAVDVENEAPVENDAPTQPQTQKATQKKVTATRRAPAKKKTPTPEPDVISDLDDEDEIEDSDADVIPLSQPVKTTARPSRAAAIASTRAMRKQAPSSPNEVPDSEDSFNADDEVVEASDSEADVGIALARGRKRAAPAAKKAPAKKARAPASRAKAPVRRAAADDSGDDVDDVVPTRGRSTRGTQNTQGTQNTTQNNTWGRSRRG